MNLINDTSRFVLFGGETPEMNMRTTPGQIFLSKMNYWIRRLFGLKAAPPLRFRDYIWMLGAHDLRVLSGNDNRVMLPPDLPRKLFATVDDVLRNRGGLKGDAPLYWASPRGAVSSPFFWSILVDYQPVADPSAIGKMEASLEDALTRAGYDFNIRIQSRPLRIEIDKPRPPLVKLADQWAAVAAMPQNGRWAFLGLTWMRGQTTTLSMQMSGEDFSAFIAGSPGSGKTQLSMTMLLSLAMSNSPAALAMVIIDPKVVDFRPFGGLPHLALPVINEPTRAAEAIQSLVNEMDARTQRAARGDTSFLQRVILLYVDELADLIMSLPNSQAQEVTNGLQRLSQKGRGVGFIVIGATQRVYDVPASAHSKLNARLVGRMRTANDSVAASGIPGTQTNRLPGRGSFELYCSDQMGLRIQAPFVASAEDADYEAQIGRFIADIVNRWGSGGAHWTQGGYDDQGGQVVDSTATPVEEASATNTGGLAPELFAELRTLHEADGLEAVTTYAVRTIYASLFGRQLDGSRAKRFRETFLGLVGSQVAVSAD